MTKVYLATSGEYSDYHVVAVFARKEDAEAYELADDVEEYELHDGPVDIREWHTLMWWPGSPDRGEDLSKMRMANPAEHSQRREFDGHPQRAQHEWFTDPAGAHRVVVSGWDLQRVRKVYSEQRAQYIASSAASDDH